MYANASYNNLQSVLFDKIKIAEKNDYLKHFFGLKFSKNSSIFLKKQVISNIVEVNFGKIVEITIDLGPTDNGHIKRKGHELINSMLQFYNKEYWIITLWISMYEHSSDSEIGRELTRAFIKNCISQTTIELLKNVENNIDKKHLSTPHISNLNVFYREVFSINNIVRNMRREGRKKLFRHYKTNKIKRINTDLQCYKLEPEGSLSALFKDHDLDAFIPLIEMSSSFVKKDGINDPLETFVFFLSGMRSKGNFKRKLRMITKGE